MIPSFLSCHFLSFSFHFFPSTIIFSDDYCSLAKSDNWGNLNKIYLASMAPSKLRKAIGHVKDQTRISLARVGGSTSLSDLEVAIVKATRHEERPSDERYIREIMCITSYSRSYVIACVNTLSGRLNKTKSWTVALKTLMLIQRLLVQGDPGYQQEMFFSTRRGTWILNLSDFRDTSGHHSWDFSAFVRTYALYLDQRLEYDIQDRHDQKEKPKTMLRPDEVQENENSNDKEIVSNSSHFLHMNTDQIFTKLQFLQQLLERFLACRPTGLAKSNIIVTVALYQIVKESFQLYYDITEILEIFVDRFMELDLVESLNLHEVFCHQGKQFDELDNFYSWCKSVGIGRPSEYPEIEKITQKKLDLIDELMQEKKHATERIENVLTDDEQEEEVKEPEPIEEEVNVDKALPAPEAEVEEAPFEEEPKKDKEEDDSKCIVVKQEVDLLNLGEHAMSSEDHTKKIALALFDGSAPTEPPPGPSWEAIKDEADWESALVQSTSNLNHQKAKLGGGFDVLMLDGMYQQGQTMAAMASPGVAANGSSSSVAFGLAGRPETLALSAPPSSDGKITETNGGDPFAASLAVAPPSYVQMSDMDKKHRFLVEEQAMWEQYKRSGLQGHAGM